MQALARNTDPISSHLAAADVEKSGKADAQRVQCLEAVRRYAGQTARELSKKTGLDRYMLNRRLPELAKAGKVQRGDIRPCGAGGRPSLTWWLVKTRKEQQTFAGM